MIKTINGKRPSTLEKPFWIVSYTSLKNYGSANAIKTFKKLKDTKVFCKDMTKYGYLVRGEGDNIRTFAGYFNGFEPNTTEAIFIRQLFGYVPEAINKIVWK